MARFTENNLIIPLCAQATSVTDNVEMDCFNMGKYNHATVIMIFAASLVGDNVLTVETGATDGADVPSDCYFEYRLGGTPGSASADVLAAGTRANTLTLTAATYQGKMLVLEIDAEDLSYPFVTVDFDGAASTGTVTAFAILSEPRYAEAVMDTAIPTS